MSKINFTATLFKPDASAKLGMPTLLTLPKDASAKLPSKGMTMVEGTINDFPFKAALEPDGEGSHWFKIDDRMLDGAKADVGDAVNMSIEPTKNWPEPRVPKDMKAALADNPEANAVWTDITPMARWDWIRWVTSAKQEKTRERRVMVMCSKLTSGKRRPCCFDRTQCTLTDA